MKLKFFFVLLFILICNSCANSSKKTEKVNIEQIENSSLDRASFNKVISSLNSKLKACYEDELANIPDLSGKVTYSWEINPKGHVEKIRVKETTLKNENVEKCVATLIIETTFPKPKNNRNNSIIYPFTFNPI